MDNFSRSLLDKIEYLLKLQVGDISRLEHIKKSIVENKKIYHSDIEYVEKLEIKNVKRTSENSAKDNSSVDFSCWKCDEKLQFPAKYCPNCGANQNSKESDFDAVLARRKLRHFNPLKMISNLHSYQVLAVIGGLASLIPILIAINSIERIFEIIEYYSGRDLSNLLYGFLGVGVVSGIWCFLVIVIPFFIKKPKKVGKFLFYSSFGILIVSLLAGVIGFPIILFSGILALKKRRY